MLGQNNSSIYRAYVIGDMGKWKKTMDSLENVIPKTNKEKLDLINYQYGYIAWCIDKNKDAEAEVYLEKTQVLLKHLEKQNYSLSMLYAYKAAFIGFEIGISPYKAPFIGSESLRFARQSLALDSQNAFAYVQLGNIAFYTPQLFGGSKSEAMEHYEKAIRIMEEEGKQLLINWNYLNLLATTINAYMKFEKYNNAKNLSVKTLYIEPNFEWVKNELYPQILKKL